MNSAFQYIKAQCERKGWANKKWARFIYDPNLVLYKVAELDDDRRYLVSDPEESVENLPVAARGFIAFLIQNWGKLEQHIYTSYYLRCLAIYKSGEGLKPGAFKRDLDREFYSNHLKEEEIRIKRSAELFSYLTLDESKLIDQYVKAYFDFIKYSFGTQRNIEDTYNLSVKQIALIYFYEGKVITRENADEIAALYGYTSKTSGEGLFQDYTFLSSHANRIGEPDTQKKLMNKIKLFKSIVELLSNERKERALDEIKILEKRLETHY